MNEGRILKRSLTLAGHRTSVSLEQVFWEALKTIAARRGLSLAALVSQIDAQRGEANLSSALRVYVLKTVLKDQAQEQPAHDRKGAPSFAFPSRS